MINYATVASCQIPGLAELYTKHFPRPGTFVEIGAYDGYTYSNTATLPDYGWKGVLAEPIKEYAYMCRDRFLNKPVQVVEEAVGDFEGDVEITVAGPLSTAKPNESLYTFEQAGNTEVLEALQQATLRLVPATTLESLLVRTRIEPRFELLVVDVEGMEWDIFKNFHLAKWSPRMIIVERHEESPEWQDVVWHDNEHLNDYFQNNFYQKIYKDEINTIFLYGV